VRYLLDTNILSELRRGLKAEPGLVTWFDDQSAEALFISAVTVGEIRQGIEQIRRKDPGRAGLLDRWLRGLAQYYEDRLLYIDGAIAEEWGRLRARRNVPVIDGLLAATARVHDLALVTKNVRGFRELGVRVVSPG
jgi:toxin FitB